METIKMIKSLKQSNILISDDYICGSDEFFNIFSIIYTDDIEDKFKNTSFILKDYLDCIKKTGDYCPDEILKNYIIYYNMMNLKTSCLSKTNNILFSNDNIRDYNNFNELLSLKKTNGMKFFKINSKFIMSTFNSIHPVNKSDTIALKIYDVDDISFLAEFIIDKKKYKISEFIRFRYLF